MRLLVDTNVFLDYLLKRPSTYQDSYDFFKFVFSHHHQIVISPMSFRDIEYILRKVEPNSLARKKALVDIYGIVYKIIDLTPDDVINAIYEDHTDFEDGLLIESAERKMIDGIVTNNIKGFIKGKVPSYTPKQIVGYLQNS